MRPVMICDCDCGYDYFCTAGKCMHCLTNEQQEQVRNLVLWVAQIATSVCGFTARYTAQQLLRLQHFYAQI